MSSPAKEEQHGLRPSQEALIDNAVNDLGALREAPNTYFYLCILVSTLGSVLFGVALGFTSPTLCANKAGKDSACPIIDCGNVTHGSVAWDNAHCDNADKMNCELQFSTTYSSLFGSIINIACLCGALCGGTFVDRFGKKKGMITAIGLYVVGWVLVYFVPSPTDATWDGSSSNSSNIGLIQAMLTIARLVLGFGVGIVCCSVSNYQTEICTLSLRGAIGTVFQLGVVIGLFVVYLVGSIVTWRTLSLLCLIASAVSLIITFMLPESPIWLLTKGREEEAEEALYKVRNPEVGSLQEMLAEMKDTVQGNDSGNDDKAEQTGGLSELYSDWVCRKALFIGVGLMFVQQLSGINAVMFYSGQIFSAVPGTSSATANTYSTGIQAMQVLITGSSAFFMDRAGRVPILLFAGIGQFVACMCLASYYLFADCVKDDQDNVVSASMGVFPVVSLYCYVFFFSCGMGAIPWFVMGEIFKPSVKGVASSIATAVNWLLSFAITDTVATLSNMFVSMLKGSLPNAIDPGMGGLFMAYGAVCFLGIIFVFTTIPETKGLTAREVQHKLAGKKGPLASGSNRSSFASSFASSHEDVFGKHGGRNSYDPMSQHEAILNP